MNYDSFSHGQIKSKLWLCQTIENYLPTNPKLSILGSWYNVLSFMLLTRNPTRYEKIVGIDVDKDAIDIADKITSTWIIDDGLVQNKIGDVNYYDYTDSNVIINCSSEHMNSTRWFNNIPKGTLVCIQSSNVVNTEYPWLVTNPSPTIESFGLKYGLTKTYFIDTLPIRYKHGQGYDRYMLIGVK